MSRIYLVDDHAIVRDGLRAVLAGAGHVVVGESAIPTQAIAEIQSLGPDVLLLDLNLRDRSGLELLADLHRRGTTTRSIVLTMSVQPLDVSQALRHGASGYLLKGAGGSEVLHAIETVMTGRRYLGAEVAELAAQALLEERKGEPLSTLSPRERQVIVMVARGWSSVAIGKELHLSPKTVDTYRSRLMEKLGVDGMAALIRLAIRAGIIDVAEP